ncbi:F-box DNA helicase 1 [Patella vulgata]|uniref:F-box DNA helicase 1 n=1 Tax=Patella vulgata TaxID=6465 RepID=UPI0024A7D17B|nr:F-box DNA helicase 1 [Patella vulgata]
MRRTVKQCSSKSCKSVDSSFPGEDDEDTKLNKRTIKKLSSVEDNCLNRIPKEKTQGRGQQKFRAASSLLSISGKIVNQSHHTVEQYTASNSAFTLQADHRQSSEKKRRIKADVNTCFEYARKEFSAQNLSCPLKTNLYKRSQDTDVNKGLYPKTLRLRKKQIDVKTQIHNTCDTFSAGQFGEKTSSFSKETGFKTAASLYKDNSFTGSRLELNETYIQFNHSFVNLSQGNNSSISQSKIKRPRKHKIGKNQKPITNFFTSTTVKTKSEKSDLNELSMSEYKGMNKPPPLPTTPSKLYSPLKQISPSIFIESPPGKKATEIKQTTDVAKKLFHGRESLYSTTKEQANSKKRKINPKPIRTLQAKSAVVFSPTVQNFMDSDDDDFENVESKDVINKAFGLVESKELLDLAEPEIERTCCETNYFEILPIEVTMNIFCRLPILDLCLNCNRVCKQWNDIISDEKFLAWKKQYFKQLKGVTGGFNIKQMLTSGNMLTSSQFLLSFIRYIKDFKPVTYIGGNMTDCLKTHPKYNWACELIKEKATDCIKVKTCNPWSIIACLVVISESVLDVQNILNCLLKTTSQCPVTDVLECFYCMATLMNAMMKRKPPSVWNGMHYRLFYAVYLFENTSISDHGMLQDAIKGSTGQQTLIKYGTGDTSVRLTHEQLRIVKYTPMEKEIIKIVAFAGTGKTTTLVRYTQLRPNLRFLLVVYNKSVCEHAKTKFPSNVTIKTGHGLAFGVTGRRYKAANKLNSYGLKVYSVAMELQNIKGENLYVRAKFVLETLNNFLSSSDKTVNIDHAPSFHRNDDGVIKVIEDSSKLIYVNDAAYLWRRMKDYNDKKIGMTHDGYLKLYQLQEPQLSDYDVILIDEAQDLTPSVIDIMLQQRQTKILVGDPHQQIYSFRGAVNAMQHIPSTKTFYLTQSFRFGPEIAHVAACCLQLLKKVTEKTIVGHGKPGKITGETIGQLAIIARCNFTLFAEAVKKCCYSNMENQKVGFVGGTDGFGFPIIQDIYTLMMPSHERIAAKREIRNSFIARFKTIGDLEKYATKAMDPELLGKIKIVKTYNHNLPGHIDKILSKTIKDISVADVVFSTAHKAKGLEFSTVKVTDDYTYLGPGSSVVLGPGPIPYDESNLLYVAITRAKQALQLSPVIVKILKESGMKFETPVLSEVLKEKKTPFKCHVSGAEFQPKVFTLQKETVKLGCGTVLSGGLLSPQVLYEDCHPFKELLGEEPEDDYTGRADLRHLEMQLEEYMEFL